MTAKWGSGHPLAAVVDMLRPSGVLWREIRLPELDWEQTAMLVNDMLRGGMRRIKPLAQALHQKTGGNPFFLHQLLQSLGHNRALSFNLNRWRWEWDLESVHKLPYHEEVLDFLEDKLKRLDPETLDVLKEAACCGHSFSTDYLAAVGKRPLKECRNVCGGREVKTWFFKTRRGVAGSPMIASARLFTGLSRLEIRKYCT